MASCHTHAALVSAVSAAPSYFRAERLGREKVLRVVGLNPTGITRGCSCLNCTSFIRRVWHPCHTHAALVSAVSAAPFYFRAERLGREKVLKVVGLNPTGITMGVQLSQLHLFILGGYGILPYPRTPLMIAVVFLGGYGILPYPRTSLMIAIVFLGGYGIPAIPTQP